MLRLAVRGGSADDWIAVARRLSGASLDTATRPEDADAVVVFDASDGIVERLLVAGKAVLLADLSILTVDNLAAWSAQPRLSVCNLDRFRPARRFLAQQAKQLGQPGLIRVHRWAKSLTVADLLRDLESVLWLFGQTPNVIQAFGMAELLQVHLGFPGGGMALLGHATGAALADGYSSLSLIGSSGAAYSDDHSNRQLLFTTAATQAIRARDEVLTLTAVIQSFVLGGPEPTPSLADWRGVLAVRDAVQQSLATGRASSVEAS